MEIYPRLNEHLEDVLKSKSDLDWFVLCLQGSQNYGIADENSDIDSKMLTLPSIKDIVVNKKPFNHVHIMSNDEHVDCKDIREYFKIMRKMNINFQEILFTDYWIVNELYSDLWLELISHREEIAHANPYRFMKCCKGMVLEKAHALDHPYPSKLDLIKKYGYDGKQLSHMIRVYDFACNYVEGMDYKDCLIPKNADYLMAIKRHSADISLENAYQLRDEYTKKISELEIKYNKYRTDEFDPKVSDVLDDILYNTIMRKIKKEL